VTFDVMTLFVCGLPIIVYSLTGFIGGSPVTVKPMGLVKSPITGMVRCN
jgi:hypothetical protein